MPPIDLRNRSVLNLDDFTQSEIAHLLALAARLKADRKAGTEQKHLIGKSIALIFEKSSTRTRVGFEVAAYDQGAHVTFLGPSGTQIGVKESMKDTARVLGRIYHAIEYRGFAQTQVETLAKYSGVPVYNGLTDEFHPTQILADLLTMSEHSGRPLEKLAFCFVGDAANNMGCSLLIGGALMGMDVRLCGPGSLWPKEELIEHARVLAKASGARITVTDKLAQGLAGTDFVYTDVWLSMGEPETEWGERIKLLAPYQINAAAMALAGSTAGGPAKFMHCLPALHDTKTKVGAELAAKFGMGELEVTDEVFESKASIVFDQAENRMHTIKAILVATLGA